MRHFEVLQALGHEIRWQLVSELCGSDLTVRELTARTGEAQNLVSYHLRILRDAGVVRERRSSADGRDVYYTLERRAVSARLHDVLATLDPAARLFLSHASRASIARSPVSVLFICTGNSARSQIAEAMLGARGGRRLKVRSAGTRPVGVHPQVRRVLASRGIPAPGLRSKSTSEFAGQAFDYVVSLCDVARLEPLEVRGKPRLIHWSIPDPVAAHGGHAVVARAFARVTDEIQTRVDDFWMDLQSRPTAA